MRVAGTNLNDPDFGSNFGVFLRVLWQLQEDSL